MQTSDSVGRVKKHKLHLRLDTHKSIVAKLFGSLSLQVEFALKVAHHISVL